MAIETIQQLKNYIDNLPWYKKIFFPRKILTVLNHPSFEKVNNPVIVISALFIEVRTSIFWRFYNWLFPDLGGLGSFCKLKSGINPSGLALIRAIRHQYIEQIEHIVNLPPADRPDAKVLIEALIEGAKHHKYGLTCYRLLEQEQVYDTAILNGAFDVAFQAQDWEVIRVFANLHTQYNSKIYQRLDMPTCNKFVLLTASAHQTFALTDLLEQEEIAQKISIATIRQVLMHRIAPVGYEHDSDIALFKSLLSFKDFNDEKLSTDFIQTLYLQAIKNGRLEAIKVLQALPGIQPVPMESLIEAVKLAAQYRHYETVLHLIPLIPKDKRLEVLQTKALIESEHLKPLNVPDKAHILQWAVSRSKPKDIQTITDALNAQERFILMTQCDDPLSIDDISPLSLTAANGWGDNLIILLSTLSSEQVMEALLPKRVSLATPLCQCHYKEERDIIVPIFLEKIFGKNPKLHEAYNLLITKKNDSGTLDDMRDYYLSSHFPSSIQKSLSFFKHSFSIPGYNLSKEELDKVVRVAFYQRYDEYDRVGREKIEARMNEYEHSLMMAAPQCQN